MKEDNLLKQCRMLQEQLELFVEALEPAKQPKDETTLADLQHVGATLLKRGYKTRLVAVLNSAGLKNISSCPPELYGELYEGMCSIIGEDDAR